LLHLQQKWNVHGMSGEKCVIKCCHIPHMMNCLPAYCVEVKRLLMHTSSETQSNIDRYCMHCIRIGHACMHAHNIQDCCYDAKFLYLYIATYLLKHLSKIWTNFHFCRIDDGLFPHTSLDQYFHSVAQQSKDITS